MTAKVESSREKTAALSLAEVGLGQRVRVVGVRYRGPRGRAPAIQPGAELRCVDRHPGAIVVRTASGRSRRLPRSAASCIAVEPLAERW